MSGLKMLECRTIASGSTGNCVFFRTESHSFLIDAGISMRRIDSALKSVGSSLSQVEGIFITHEHSDHVKALNMIVRHTRIPIYATLPTAREIYAALSAKSSAQDADAFRERVRTITPGLCYSAGELSVKAFEIPHDSACCVGYVLQDDNGEKLLGHAADMGHITSRIVEELEGCRNLIVESNHDLQMLEDSSYPAFLKERIRSDYGHLSNPDCAKLVCHLAERGTRNITLFHLSQENNLPSLALEETLAALKNAGAEENRDFTLRAAPKEGIGEVCR